MQKRTIFVKSIQYSFSTHIFHSNNNTSHYILHIHLFSDLLSYNFLRLNLISHNLHSLYNLNHSHYYILNISQRHDYHIHKFHNLFNYIFSLNHISLSVLIPHLHMMYILLMNLFLHILILGLINICQIYLSYNLYHRINMLRNFYMMSNYQSN